MVQTYLIPRLDKDCYEHEVFERLTALMKLSERLVKGKRNECSSAKNRIAVLKDISKLPQLKVPEIQELTLIIRNTAFDDVTKYSTLTKNGKVQVFSAAFLKEASSAVDELMEAINNHQFFFDKLRRAQEDCVASRKELFRTYLMLAVSTIEIRGAIRMQTPGIKDKRQVLGKLLTKARAWREKHEDDVRNYTELYKEELELRKEVEKISCIIEKAICARLTLSIDEFIVDKIHLINPMIVATVDTERIACGIFCTTSDIYVVPEPVHPSKARYDPRESEEMPVAVPEPEFANIVPYTEIKVSFFVRRMCRPIAENNEDEKYHIVTKDVPKNFIPGALKLKAGQVLKQKFVSCDGMIGFGWTRRSRFASKTYGFFPRDVVQKMS